MARVTCGFCGLPFHVRTVREATEHFCCSGCALASRIPMHGDALLVSRELVVALALGFGLFNQTLFAVLGTAVTKEGNAEVGATFITIAIAVGAVLFAVSGLFLVTARSRRWSDGLAALAAASLAAFAGWRGCMSGVSGIAAPLLIANLWLGAWWSRGWLRKFVARSRRAGKPT
jgi:hypothetical protein